MASIPRPVALGILDFKKSLESTHTCVHTHITCIPMCI